jgi:hypothetical protein
MDSNLLNLIELNEEQEECIIKLINLIISKSPHLEELKFESIVLMRLLSFISLIETTLCSKYQIVLKRNSTPNQSINLIKSWLKQYYNQEFIDPLCQTIDSQNNINNNNNNNNNNNSNENENKIEIIDNNKSDIEITQNDININENSSQNTVNKDIALISLMILSIAYKLRISLPRIKAYFEPLWQTLSQFDYVLHQITNCDKLLELVQNELCIKRKQLEVTKSKVTQLQSSLNSRILQQNREKKTKVDYRSNLFAEYEDNDDNEPNNSVSFDESDNELSDKSDESDPFVDDPSDDDYVPKNKLQKLSKSQKSTKKSKRTPISKKGVRGRRPKDGLNPIRITPQMKSATKGRGRPPKAQHKTYSIEGDSESMSASNEGPFECDVCGKQFAKEYRLTRHAFTHKGHKQFQCDYPNCEESFDLKWKLTEHKHEHSGDADNDDDDGYGYSSNQLFECEWADCGLSFNSKRELTIHEHELHANRSTSKYSCDWPQCKEIFENKIDWRKHVKTHGKIVPTECGFPGCHKSFFKLDSLENHRKIHETFSLTELS